MVLMEIDVSRASVVLGVGGHGGKLVGSLLQPLTGPGCKGLVLDHAPAVFQKFRPVDGVSDGVL